MLLKNKLYSKSIVSILDQGVFTGTNFILAILLGRWLTQEAYGAYSLALVVFLLASGQYISFLLEPMSVLGPNELRSNQVKYFGFLVKSHFGFTLVLTFIILILSALITSINNPATRMMAILLPFILAIWLVRWFYFMQGQPQKSLIVSISYFALVIIGLFVLYNSGNLTSSNVFIVIAVASLVPSIIVALKSLINRDGEPLSASKLILEHWNYGKWIGLASILNWLAIQIFMIFIVVLIDLQAAGGLKSLLNFAQPLEQISTALGLLLIPLTSRFYVDHSTSKYNSIIKNVNWILLAIGVTYLVVLWVLKDVIFFTAYDGNYQEFANLIPLVIVVPIIYSMSRGAQIGIRAIRQPRKLLYSYSVAAASTLILGPLLIHNFGFLGALIGMIITAILFSTTTNLFYYFSNKGKLDEPKISEKVLF